MNHDGKFFIAFSCLVELDISMIKITVSQIVKRHKDILSLIGKVRTCGIHNLLSNRHKQRCIRDIFHIFEMLKCTGDK